MACHIASYHVILCYVWHLINMDVHNPSSVKKWSSQYPIFKEAGTNVWPRIFKLPFIPVRDTKIQTFQYRLIQKNYSMQQVVS